MSTQRKNQTSRPSLKELLLRGDLIAPEELAAGMRVARVTVITWGERACKESVRGEIFQPDDERREP